MLYKHKHHIIPRHAGGTNDVSNIVELTVEEQKKKMSDAATRSWTKERIEKAKEHQTGRKLSEETKEKIRQSKLGQKLSEETKKKISEGLNRRLLEKGELVSR